MGIISGLRKYFSRNSMTNKEYNEYVDHFPTHPLYRELSSEEWEVMSARVHEKAQKSVARLRKRFNWDLGDRV